MVSDGLLKPSFGFIWKLQFTLRRLEAYLPGSDRRNGDDICPIDSDFSILTEIFMASYEP